MLDAMRDVAREAPDFAPGHSDLAKHIAFLLPGLPPDETSGLRQEAEREARRALQLDPKDPDAFVALGLLAPPRDYSQRDRLFRLALAADPSWPHANGFLGNVMTSLGRLDEALALYQRAASVNPQSMDWAGVAAQGLVWDGQTREADIELAHLSDLWPGNPEVWEVQLSSDLAQRRWADALAHISGADPAERASVPLARLVPELAALSTHDPAAMASARQRDLELGRTDPRGAIIGLAFLGFADDAFDIAQHYSPDFDQDPEFLFSPLTAILRNDPRFMALAAKFGLPAYWRRTRKWPDFCSEPKLSYDCAAQARGL
jgi:tetratricopeptide (TPR) repeat protein